MGCTQSNDTAPVRTKRRKNGAKKRRGGDRPPASPEEPHPNPLQVPAADGTASPAPAGRTPNPSVRLQESSFSQTDTRRDTTNTANTATSDTIGRTEMRQASAAPQSSGPTSPPPQPFALPPYRPLGAPPPPAKDERSSCAPPPTQAAPAAPPEPEVAHDKSAFLTSISLKRAQRAHPEMSSRALRRARRWADAACAAAARAAHAGLRDPDGAGDAGSHGCSRSPSLLDHSHASVPGAGSTAGANAPSPRTESRSFVAPAALKISLQASSQPVTESDTSALSSRRGMSVRPQLPSCNVSFLQPSVA